MSVRSIQNFSPAKIIIIGLGDIVLLSGAYVLSFWVRSFSRLLIFDDILPLHRFLTQFNHHYLLLVGLQIFLLYSFGLYDRLKHIRLSEMIRLSSSAITIQVLILIASYYFVNDLLFPRSIFPLFWLFNIVLVSSWRIFLTRCFKIKGSKRRVLIVGTSAIASELIREIERLAMTGLEIIGIVTDSENELAETIEGYPIVGASEDIPEIIERYAINEVIITPHISWQDRLLIDISKSEKTHARVSIIPSMYEIMIAKMHHLKIHDIPLVEVLREPTGTLTRASKAGLDLICALLGLIVTGLLFLFIAPLIKLGSPGPVFFRQERVGSGGALFKIIKFRTMRCGAEDATGPILSGPDDDRVTTIGRFLRRWRLDELPQFWCILKGEMSLVGPRPERPYFVDKYKSEIPGYAVRFKIKPGLTGLAQVNGSNLTGPENKLRYDLAYIYNQSIWLDILIILATIKYIITGRVP
ncbi:sugar transferase [bacterium]|nr:sugar transferase [bacterium]